MLSLSPFNMKHASLVNNISLVYYVALSSSKEKGIIVCWYSKRRNEPYLLFLLKVNFSKSNKIRRESLDPFHIFFDLTFSCLAANNHKVTSVSKLSFSFYIYFESSRKKRQSVVKLKLLVRKSEGFWLLNILKEHQIGIQRE